MRVRSFQEILFTIYTFTDHRTYVNLTVLLLHKEHDDTDIMVFSLIMDTSEGARQTGPRIYLAVAQARACGAPVF